MDKDTDSVRHHQERRDKMKWESEDNARAEAESKDEREVDQSNRDQVTRESEIKYLEQQVGLVRATDTRELLLDRIRKLREPLPPPPGPPPRTKAQQEELEREQAAGRAAVAVMKEQEERNQAGWRAHEEEERKRLGTMETVHHPNPTQAEQFPASGATLGKVKK